MELHLTPRLRVHPHGYRTAERDGEDTLVPLVADESPTKDAYTPEALFLIFADVAGSSSPAESALAFANKYGVSGLEPPTLKSLLRESKRIAALWEAATASSIDGLKELGRTLGKGWKPSGWAFEPDILGEWLKLKQWIAFDANHDEPHLNWRQKIELDERNAQQIDNVRETIVFAVINMIAAPWLCPDRIEVGLGQDSSWTAVYENVIGYCWAELVDSIKANRRFRQCAVCGKPIVNRRGRREYCSDACRTRAAKARQLEAVRLFRLGKSESDIAEELSTPEDTIKRWILKAKGKDPDQEKG